MLALYAAFALQQISTTPKPISDSVASQGPTVRKVAVLPWTMKDGGDTAQKTVREAIGKVFEKANYEEIPEIRAKSIWEEDLHFPAIQLEAEGSDEMKPLPTPEQLLKLGQTMNADLVCAGRARWHTRSIWISLGPKTKSDCTVDLILVDVANKEVVLDAKGVKADDTKSEELWQTAGALFVSMGFTAFSGGPKTPHEQRAGAQAVVKAFEPWLKTVAPKSRKIGG